MTEQEAEVLAARLTRIWGTVTPIIQLDSNTYGGYIVFSLVLEARVITSGLFFKMSSDTARGENDFELRAWSSGPMYINNYPACERHLPIFRRGCWLSGCPIEATTHEKAEWVQGFTPEEVEAWNLKM